MNKGSKNYFLVQNIIISQLLIDTDEPPVILSELSFGTFFENNFDYGNSMDNKGSS